ncbi:MAG: LacI family DNA-binding transcriptional regulator [Planctomycetes bacterium]|nr:LacI family DNA-binding transcriptional regulator [Planctomycetota bacterium]
MAKKKVSLQDVAQRVNYSKTTVSSVLNSNDRIAVSQETKKLILDTAAEMGYSINYHARVMNTGIAHMIGHGPVAAHKHDWQNENAVFYTARVFDDMQLGCFQVCADNAYGYQIINYEGEYVNDSHIQHSLHYLKENRIDALIFHAFPAALAHRLLKSVSQKPIISYFWGSVPENYPLPYVAIDSRPAIDEVVQHLKKSGHKKVLYVGGEGVSQRDQFCVDAISDQSMEVQSVSIPAPDVYRKKVMQKGHSFTDGYQMDYYEEQFAAWLDENDLDCTAILAGSDCTALGIMRVCAQRGISIPDDVAIIGFDNVFAEMQTIPLSSVDQNFYRIGRKISQIAVDLLKLGPSWQSRIVEFQVTIPSTLHIRESSNITR